MQLPADSISAAQRRNPSSVGSGSIRIIGMLVALALTGAAGCSGNTDSNVGALSAASISNFTDAYQGGSDSSCGTTYSIIGAEPNDGLKHPVFIYTVGTWESYDAASALAAVNGMAARGYVAATVAYANDSFGDCGKLGLRAQCLYNPTNPSSAASTLCARGAADCSKGVVTAGFSQGSVMATLAHDYNPAVQAVYGIGDGVRYSIYNLNSCMSAGQYSLPSDRLRVVNGIHDQFLGPSATGAYSQSRTVTGMDCPDGSTSCFRSNGSGWYVVQNIQVEDGFAEHCYMYIRHGLQDSCPETEYSLDAGWENGTDAWQLNANLDWLAGFAQP